MARPILRATLLGAALAAVTAGVLVWAILGSMRVTCEVCITYHGRTACRSATGSSREETLRTATDNACAFLASGMTESIDCSNTPPDSSSCRP